MGRLADNLHRTARFWAGLPPDATTHLLAILERPELLASFAVWASNAVAGELFTSFLFLILGLCAWPLLPKSFRTKLLKVRDYFLPSAIGKDKGLDSGRDKLEEPSESTQEVADPRSRVEVLQRELGRLEGRLELMQQTEIVTQAENKRLVDDLERERERTDRAERRIKELEAKLAVPQENTIETRRRDK